MERIALKSRLIESVAYNAETEVMHVWLQSKRHVTHANIPADIFDTLVNAESPGFYYTRFVVPNDVRVPQRTSWFGKLMTSSALAMALVLMPGW